MSSPIVDAHLDLAWNMLAGRDYTHEISEIREEENRTDHQCMVSLPELRHGGIAVAFATIFANPSDWSEEGSPVYTTPPWESARTQLAVYRGWEAERRVRVLTSRSELDAHLETWERDHMLGLVLLMESADSIEKPSDLTAWRAAGVRVIGPAWSRT